MVLALDRVRWFEQEVGESVQSLISLSLRVAGNPEGYALYRDGRILATLSRNPRAGWATQTYGVDAEAPAAAERVVGFFNAHGVAARVRIVPGALTPALADVLSRLGLRHVGFHTMLWAALPVAVEPPTAADIRVVSSLAEMDAHIDIQLSVYGVPHEVIDRLRPLRRAWFGSSGRRHYLAYVDGQPAAQACLFWRDDVAYLESAGTLSGYRNRGLQQALIRRRILDAAALGCRVIIGGADFESQSRTNQLACGLSVAYLAAQWVQRSESMPGAAASS
jgi:Acetyltransferase (GNAT) domain